MTEERWDMEIMEKREIMEDKFGRDFSYLSSPPLLTKLSNTFTSVSWIYS